MTVGRPNPVVWMPDPALPMAALLLHHLYVNSGGGMGLLLLLYVNSDCGGEAESGGMEAGSDGVEARSSLPTAALNSSISSLGGGPPPPLCQLRLWGGRIWLQGG
jgi:hypothetical protein